MCKKDHSENHPAFIYCIWSHLKNQQLIFEQMFLNNCNSQWTKDRAFRTDLVHTCLCGWWLRGGADTGRIWVRGRTLSRGTHTQPCRRTDLRTSYCHVPPTTLKQGNKHISKQGSTLRFPCLRAVWAYSLR